MDKIKQLVQTSQLKTNYLSNCHQSKIFFHYDDLSDTFMLLFVPPDKETIVHYLDKYVAILYTPNDYEIVGLQVDYFQSDFIPMYEDLQREWCLSDFVVKDESFWDLTLSVESKKISIALGIIKAKQEVIGKPAEEFEKTLAYA
ncbi:MAG TPA: hypothetical protein PLL88_11835 [Anaerolineaceae bacterium]|nr:hypothetical protein [Anaerolineaceae bacterium]